MLIKLYIAYDSLHTTRVSLSSCRKEPLALRSKIFTTGFFTKEVC